MKKRVFVAAALLLAHSALGAAPACDRDCLQNTITQYLDAMLTHDPSKLRLAAKVRFTEDQQELALGQGLWKSIESLSAYRQDILDVKQGIAGVHVKVIENGKPVLAAIRIQMDGDRIAGVESLLVRSREEGSLFNVDNIQQASPEMNVEPPSAQRNSREEIRRIALLYPEGLRVGSFVTAGTPFGRDAYRFENGMLMAGARCTFRAGCEDIHGQKLPVLAGIRAMDFGKSPVREVGELSMFELFKVYDGRIQAVEAFMKVVPLDTPFLWQY